MTELAAKKTLFLVKKHRGLHFLARTTFTVPEIEETGLRVRATGVKTEAPSPLNFLLLLLWTNGPFGPYI